MAGRGKARRKPKSKRLAQADSREQREARAAEGLAQLHAQRARAREERTRGVRGWPPAPPPPATRTGDARADSKPPTAHALRKDFEERLQYTSMASAMGVRVKALRGADYGAVGDLPLVPDHCHWRDVSTSLIRGSTLCALYHNASMQR